MSVFLLGLTTGMLAVVPVGAVGVLILHKGLRHGFFPAVFGALGAATADTLFAAVALWTGAAALEVLAPHRTAITLVAGCFLAGLGLWGFLRPPIGKTTFEPMLRGTALLVSFGQLFLLNCLNPLIIAFFFGAVVTAGAHGMLPDTTASLLFLAGIACAVFGWQLGLAWLGAQGMTRLSGTIQHRLSQVGHGIVVSAGIVMLISAILSMTAEGSLR
ncbi:MAG: LysE family transporter [Alphaproteobacteria bacterium]|nr:LysE family transporter [Alphaproteobacteria bacterium]